MKLRHDTFAVPPRPLVLVAFSLVVCAPVVAAPALFYGASPFGGGLAVDKGAPLGAGGLLCIGGECEAAISKTTYQNRPAYRLTNGAVEAIVVPEIGRVMSFGVVGGPNLIWNAQAAQIAKSGWKNYGGDKTWLAPQANWPSVNGSKSWPPDDALDGQPQKADVLTGGKLQLTTPLSPTGIRIVRTMYFDDNGEFVIEQRARKESGAPVEAGIWNVTQVAPGQTIFAAINPNTVYKNGFYAFENERAQPVELVKPNLARIEPKVTGDNRKMGFDTDIAALAAVSDGIAWVQKAPRPDGNYPDAPADASGPGFPTEIYLNGDADKLYQELEFLGPLHDFKVGTEHTHTVRWSLHRLPSTDAHAPAVVEAISQLLSPTTDAQ